MPTAEAFLKDQFKPSQWPVVPTILRTAYAAADALIRDNPILQIESAQDNRGRIITWAVDLNFQKAVETGMLDADCRWCPFAAPTGRYLELRFPDSRASISQVDRAEIQPRNVVFRENARLSNGQASFDLPELREEARLAGLPYFLIVHGHQSLNFAHVGVPSPRSQRYYLYLTPNLMNLPHEVSDGPPAEDTDYDLKEMELLKEQIEKWRKDSGDT